MQVNSAQMQQNSSYKTCTPLAHHNNSTQYYLNLHNNNNNYTMVGWLEFNGDFNTKVFRAFKVELYYKY